MRKLMQKRAYWSPKAVCAEAKILLVALLFAASVAGAQGKGSSDAACISISLDSVGTVDVHKDKLEGVARGANSRVANYVRVVLPAEVHGIVQVTVLYNVKEVGDLPVCTSHVAHGPAKAIASCAVTLRDRRLMTIVEFDATRNAQSYEDRARKVADFIDAELLGCKELQGAGAFIDR